jgi:phage repressor protein C with HTH and peptisase S24 domain
MKWTGFHDFGMRLRYLISEILEIPQAEFAEKLGMEESYLSLVLDEKRGPSAGLIAGLHRHCGRYLFWLLTGEGEMTTPPAGFESVLPDGFSHVPEYETGMAAGTGTCGISEEAVHRYAFRTDWLKRKCPEGRCGLFGVRGNAMLPGIGEGDLVLVDMSKKGTGDIVDGRVYAFSEGDLLKVTRLFRRGSGLVAVSDNREENPDPLEVDLKRFRLIGKVVWVGHEYERE